MCATGIIILRSIFIWTTNLFLSDPSLSISPFADLTDVTLAYEDTNSILTDNANRAIQGNVAMHVNHLVNLVVKFQTSASSVIWWQNLQTM